MVNFKPLGPRLKAKLLKFGSKMLEGICVGYHQIAGGHSSGDLLVFDRDDLSRSSKLDGILAIRVKVAELVPCKVDGNFVFPFFTGQWKLHENNANPVDGLLRFRTSLDETIADDTSNPIPPIAYTG